MLHQDNNITFLYLQVRKVSRLILFLFLHKNMLWYSKCPKISSTLFHNFFMKFLLFMQLFLKILSGMTNSVDPGQTKEQSDLDLHCLHLSFCRQL